MSLSTRQRRTTPRRAAPRAGSALITMPGESVWIDPNYRATLERAGLTSLQAFMQTTVGHCLRALRQRENWRIELRDAIGQPQGAFLKKHHTRTVWQWLRARLGLGPGATAGRVEAENIARLQRDGIAAMRLIAYGETLHADGLLESFLLTEELTNFTQLDHFLRQRFAELPEQPPAHRHRDLANLIANVADVAGRFHRLGYNHRDLYCCHFFIREPVAGRFEVNLIDLQRVEQRHRFRRRWVVKDLAQLAYSAPRERISCKHRLMFMKRYLGVRKLRPADKRLIRQVVAKWQRMEKHLGAHP